MLFGNARQNMSRQMALFSQNYLGQTLNAMEVVFSQIEDSGRQTILDSSVRVGWYFDLNNLIDLFYRLFFVRRSATGGGCEFGRRTDAGSFYYGCTRQPCCFGR